MGVFKSMRDLTQQARQIERSMPPVGDRMAAAQATPCRPGEDNPGSSPGHLSLCGAPELAGLSAPGPTGNLARLFPVVTPAPAAPRAVRARQGPTAAASGLTADTGVIGTGQGRLIVLALTLAAGIAAFGTWFTVAGPARKLVTSLARRRGHDAR